MEKIIVNKTKDNASLLRAVGYDFIRNRKNQSFVVITEGWHVQRTQILSFLQKIGFRLFKSHKADCILIARKTERVKKGGIVDFLRKQGYEVEVGDIHEEDPLC